jgi:hypothetical protein
MFDRACSGVLLGLVRRDHVADHDAPGLNHVRESPQWSLVHVTTRHSVVEDEESNVALNDVSSCWWSSVYSCEGFPRLL